MIIFAQANNDAGSRNGIVLGYKSGGLWLLQGNGSGWKHRNNSSMFFQQINGFNRCIKK